MKRTRITAYGIRIITSVKGDIATFSIINTVMQISSAIGLLLLTKTITDVIMLSMFNEKNHYSQMKYI